MANRFAFVPKALNTAKDTASAFGNTMKTFALGDDFQKPDEHVYPDGPGQAPPTPKPPSAPDTWYRSYGRYAPYSPTTKR